VCVHIHHAYNGRLMHAKKFNFCLQFGYPESLSLYGIYLIIFQ